MQRGQNIRGSTGTRCSSSTSARPKRAATASSPRSASPIRRSTRLASWSDMGALPILPGAAERNLPDYLPARMVNEFVYCPRLFFYEWVEGVFQESVDTVEGKIQHRRVDSRQTAMPPPDA